MHRLHLRRSRLALAITGCILSGAAFANAHLAPDLEQALTTAAPGDKLEVVVSFNNIHSPLTSDQVAALGALGINQALTFQALPIAGAVATPAQIRALTTRMDVLSIYPNSHLTDFNQESREQSSVARTQTHPADFGRVLPYKGFGVTAMINDSGIDATHLDLTYGDHVVQNVQALTNLHGLPRSLVTALGGPAGILPVTYVEGQPNSDTSSGHGTHCAGILGGAGARSSGLYAGVAPGAKIVGYGSGAVTTILDAVGGFDYAIINQFRFNSPIRVISNSWGSSGKFDPTNPVNLASYEAYNDGMVVLFAAGNSGPGEDTHNPYAQAPWVISVAAGDKQGRLADFSSRGHRYESASFAMPDGQRWTYVNEPAITAPGVDVISTRDVTGALPLLAAQTDQKLIAPAYLPFYTTMSGTSMATPHTAGITALILEANPNLNPLQVKDLLQRTASNIPGRASWEDGAGYVNAYVALMEASGTRGGFGSTVNNLHRFNASAEVEPGGTLPFSSDDFTPAGPAGSQTFQVSSDTAWVNARATPPDGQTVALVLIDPDGNRYGSSIALPLLGSSVAVGAPGKPGPWTISVRGIGSISGTTLDPAHVITGFAIPGTVKGTISFAKTSGYTGLNDVAGHQDRGAIQHAVAKRERLADGEDDDNFHPDDTLIRADLAQYLVMGAGVRQYLPVKPSFTDLQTSSRYYPFAEAAIAFGGALKDRAGVAAGVMQLQNGQFKPNGTVPRSDLAYSLVQSLGQQTLATSYSGDVYVTYNNQRLKLDDSASIPADKRGYAQLAIDLGLMNVRYTLTQGPFDPQPVIHGWFDPARNVTRAEYAVSAGILADTYNK
ncbi:S8 family peptidase [Dokdonella soli]